MPVRGNSMWNGTEVGRSVHVQRIGEGHCDGYSVNRGKGSVD